MTQSDLWRPAAPPFASQISSLQKSRHRCTSAEAVSIDLWPIDSCSQVLAFVCSSSVSCTQFFPKKDLDWVSQLPPNTEHRDWAQWSHQFLTGGWTQLQNWIAEESTKLQTSGSVTNGRDYDTSCLMVTVWASCPQNTEKENLRASAHQWSLSLKNFPLSQSFGSWLGSDSIELSLCKP